MNLIRTKNVPWHILAPAAVACDIIIVRRSAHPAGGFYYIENEMSMSSKVIIPWEERPAGCKDVLWRSAANPIIPRDLLPTSNSIFNSAVVPFGDGFAGVFRCDDTNRRMRLHVVFSKDAIYWNI